MGKKYIDKSKAVTYRLVPTETGPNQYDEDKPKYTFVVVPNKKNKKVADNKLLLGDDVPEPDTSERVYPSKGPRPDWDPDVVACLDDDFDFSDPENVLEDDFVVKANDEAACASKVQRKIIDDDEGSFGSDFSGDFDEDDDFEGSVDDKFKFRKGKSKLTQYSMTSAISNCTEDVQVLNDKFEKLLDEYDDDQIGALDGEDIAGNNATAEDYTMTEILGKKDTEENLLTMEKCEEDLKNRILEQVDVDDDTERIVTVVVEEKPSDTISLCGSCSSYSPAVIPVERKRTSSSSTVRSSAKTVDSLHANIEAIKLQVASLSRPKHETSEQRRERKSLVKAARKESRMVKKEVKLAFKDEKKKQCLLQASGSKVIGFKI